MKHFYTDPLAAAWMVRHFKMWLINPVDQGEECATGKG